MIFYDAFRGDKFTDYKNLYSNKGLVNNPHSILTNTRFLETAIEGHRMRYEHGRIDGMILWISFLSQNLIFCTIVADIIEVQRENTSRVEFLSIQEAVLLRDTVQHLESRAKLVWSFLHTTWFTISIPTKSRHVTLDHYVTLYATNQNIISRVHTIKKLDILPHIWSFQASMDWLEGKSSVWETRVFATTCHGRSWILLKEEILGDLLPYRIFLN